MTLDALGETERAVAIIERGLRATPLGTDGLEGPLDRLAREAVAGATATARGKGAEATNAAVRATLGATVFRFELVMRDGRGALPGWAPGPLPR